MTNGLTPDQEARALALSLCQPLVKGIGGTRADDLLMLARWVMEGDGTNEEVIEVRTLSGEIAARYPVMAEQDFTDPEDEEDERV